MKGETVKTLLLIIRWKKGKKLSVQEDNFKINVEVGGPERVLKARVFFTDNKVTYKNLASALKNYDLKIR